MNIERNVIMLIGADLYSNDLGMHIMPSFQRLTPTPLPTQNYNGDVVKDFGNSKLCHGLNLKATD